MFAYKLRQALFVNSSILFSYCTNHANKMRGAFIVLEGCDRSGKTTQCRKLAESLINRGISAEAISFPDRTTPIGKLINEYLSNKKYDLHDRAIHLLFTANRWENVNRMKKLLNNGVTLICDRYSYSGIAYSAIKPGMSLEWCKGPENGLPEPDKVYMLTLTPEMLNQRSGFGEERYENSSTQNKVLSMYGKLKDYNWKVVNATGSIDDVHNLLQSDILNVINDVKDKPIGELKFHLDNDKNF